MSMTMTKVILSPRFIKQLKQLKKQYPRVEQDVEPLKRELEVGATPGDRLQGHGDLFVYKVRLPNRDAGRGKSGGYRVIYYVKTADSVYLLLIYSKSAQDDVPDALIVQAIEEANVTEEESPQDGENEQD